MIIDLICGVMLMTGLYLGYSRGIIGTVFTIFSLLFGLIAAVKFGPQMTALLKDLLNIYTPFMFVAGFIITFVVTMILIRMIARSLEGILQTANINFINKMLGGILMAGLLLILYSWILLFADSSKLIDKQTKLESATYVYLQEVSENSKGAFKRLGPVFRDFWAYSMDFLDEVKKMGDEAGSQEEEIDIYDIED